MCPIKKKSDHIRPTCFTSPVRPSQKSAVCRHVSHYQNWYGLTLLWENRVLVVDVVVHFPSAEAACLCSGVSELGCIQVYSIYMRIGAVVFLLCISCSWLVVAILSFRWELSCCILAFFFLSWSSCLRFRGEVEEIFCTLPRKYTRLSWVYGFALKDMTPQWCFRVLRLDVLIRVGRDCLGSSRLIMFQAN